jgi:hypothetical protein
MENLLILQWLMEEPAVFIRNDRVHDSEGQRINFASLIAQSFSTFRPDGKPLLVLS